MNRAWQPSLVRRVILALLAAFVLVWVALEAYTYLEFRQAIARDQGLKKLGRAVTAALNDVGDDGTAQVVMKSTATQFQSLRISGNPAGTVLLQLLNRRGEQVYSSPALAGRPLAGLPLQVVNRQIDGKTFWVYQSDMERWSLRLAEPQLTAAWVLEFNARRMLPYLLLSFPFVLVPVWIAVKLGLRPLQRLADLVSRRGASDLSPIGLDPRYAEMKPLVTALEAMLQQLRGKVERERAFVQDAAHELRTPMAVISAQAHALTGADNGEDRARAQVHLEHAIARASHLTQQLLELAALDDARRPRPQWADVAQLARQVIAQAAPVAFARGIDIRLEAPDALKALIDVPALQSVLENLLNNALRYVQHGAQVAVTLAADSNRLLLSVEDDGPGIAPEERELVFERFHRGAGLDTTGSGLGLSIVKQAAARMGGSVAVSPGLENKGAGFHLVLPLAVTASRSGAAA